MTTTSALSWTNHNNLVIESPSHHGLAPVHYSIEKQGDFFYCYLDGEQIGKVLDLTFAKILCEKNNTLLSPKLSPKGTTSCQEPQ